MEDAEEKEVARCNWWKRQRRGGKTGGRRPGGGGDEEGRRGCLIGVWERFVKQC